MRLELPVPAGISIKVICPVLKSLNPATALYAHPPFHNHSTQHPAPNTTPPLHHPQDSVPRLPYHSGKQLARAEPQVLLLGHPGSAEHMENVVKLLQRFEVRDRAGCSALAV